MNWAEGYSASYYMTFVDPVTWRDTERLEIKGGSISLENTGLMQSADLEVGNYILPGIEQWIRVYMNTRQAGSSETIALFTGLATSPDREIKGNWDENSLQCYSVLKPADDVILPRGWYAPVEMGAEFILSRLLKPVPAPVEFSEDMETSTLDEAIVAEDGETNLTMIERILLSLNRQLRINGDGSIFIGPYSEEPSMVLDPIYSDIIETQIKVAQDLYSCPNVFMAVNNGMTGIAKDEDAESPLSIQNRGREVWMYESGSSLSDKETIAEYAVRRLKEEQEATAVNISYDRGYVPNLIPGDLVRLNYPKQGLNGTYVIESQTIQLGYHAKTSEELVGI